MRIIAGELGARHFESVPGDSTRPTTDRVREAIFSSVISYFGDDINGAKALDLFSGSGAMGFEAISRGAQSATFVDDNKKAVAVIAKNADILGISSRCKVIKENAFSYGEQNGNTGRKMVGAPYDLLFADPPYAIEYAEICKLISDLAKQGTFADGALIVYERASGNTKKHKGKSSKATQESQEQANQMLEILGDSFELVSIRTYGISQVVYFSYNG